MTDRTDPLSPAAIEHDTRRAIGHAAGRASDAEHAAAAMQAAFEKMRKYNESGEVDDVDGVHPTDWACYVQALAAAASAHSDLALALMAYDDRAAIGAARGELRSLLGEAVD